MHDHQKKTHRQTVSGPSAADAGRGNSRSTWSNRPWWQWWPQRGEWRRQCRLKWLDCKEEKREDTKHYASFLYFACCGGISVLRTDVKLEDADGLSYKPRVPPNPYQSYHLLTFHFLLNLLSPSLVTNDCWAQYSCCTLLLQGMSQMKRRNFSHAELCDN